MPTPLRIDSEQRFTCSQCGSCCYRWDVVVSDAEIDAYRRRNASSWYRESRDAAAGDARDLSAEARRAKVDPFEPVPGFPALHRIRKRADGGCGFLSAANRCRIHEELGADRKPLTCRIYPYSFHAAPDGVVVTTSFGCPTIIANDGQPIATSPRATRSSRCGSNGSARIRRRPFRASWSPAGPSIRARRACCARAFWRC